MVVGVLRLGLILHAPHSLKEKRAIVQKILGRCRSRFPVSGAETGLQELWQRSELGFAMVAQNEPVIYGIFQSIEEEIVRLGSTEVNDRHQEFIHF